MKILVDTHIYLWMLSAPEKLDQTWRYELETRSNEVFLSSIRVAELMIKHTIGKIEIRFDPIEMAEKMGMQLMDFTSVAAVVLGRLPFHHKDPFDRMLVAQSVAHNLTLMTTDNKLKQYDCNFV